MQRSSLRALFGLLIFYSLSACNSGTGASKADVAAQSGGRRAANAAGTGDSEASGAASPAAGSGGESRAAPAAAGTNAAGTLAEPAKHNQSNAGSAGSAGAVSSQAGQGGVAGHNETQAAAGQGGGAAGGSQAQPAAGQGGGGAGGSQPVAAGQGGAGTAGATAGGSAPDLCTGAKPSASAFGAASEAFDTPSQGVGSPIARTQPGKPAPRYHLTDFQPMSCGYHATYGLDTFQGRPTLVALFASWCPYCREQVGKLQQLQLELEDAGKSVHMVLINAADKYGSVDHDAIANQYELVNRVTFPLLQDTDAVDAWALHGGIKDDLLIYRSDGTLQIYLPKYMGTIPTDLTTAEGYAAVKDLLMGTP